MPSGTVIRIARDAHTFCVALDDGSFARFVRTGGAPISSGLRVEWEISTARTILTVDRGDREILVEQAAYGLTREAAL
jgi:hypothetical protein